MKTNLFAKVFLALVCAVTALAARPSEGATLSGYFGSAPPPHTHLWGYASWSRSDDGNWWLWLRVPSHSLEGLYAIGGTQGSWSGSGDSQYMAYQVISLDNESCTTDFQFEYAVTGGTNSLYDGFTSNTALSTNQGSWTWN